METATFLLVLGIIMMVFLAMIRIRDGSGDFSYRMRPALFTPAERSFLGVLEGIVGKDAKVYGKIRVADVLCVEKGLSPQARQVAFNKISSKHFDFVLCHAKTVRPICVIELDDKSHNSRKRKRRDAFLVGACQSAGIPLIRIPARREYPVREIRSKLAPYLQ